MEVTCIPVETILNTILIFLATTKLNIIYHVTALFQKKWNLIKSMLEFEKTIWQRMQILTIVSIAKFNYLDMTV